MKPFTALRPECSLSLVLLAGCDSSVGAVDAAPDSVATDVAAEASVPTDRATADVVMDARADDAFAADASAPDASVGDASAGDASAGDASAGDASVSDASVADVAGDAAPTALPLTAPAGAWTWVPLEGAVCDDGSPTGVGVNLVAGAPGVLVFFTGGGVCGDYQTCAVLNTSVHGPFGDAQFAVTAPQFAGSILDRTAAGNPFAAWSMVFVPNCTGDAFAGARDATYTSGAATRVIRHRGRTNALSLLRRLAVTADPTGRVALVGISTGALGAMLLHDTFRTTFSRAAGFYVFADSAPLLRGDAMPATLRNAWYESWGLGWLDPLCSACRGDLSQLYGQLATRYPNDRTALATTLQDRVMRAYYSADAAAYETAVRATVDGFNTLAQRHAFVAAGDSHVLLGRMSADGAALAPWLTQWITDATSWTSRNP